MFKNLLMLASGVTALAVTGCAERAQHPVAAAIGPAPMLEAPKTALLPTVKIAEAIGWADGQTPVAASGLAVKAFGTGLDHPRWLP